MSRFKPISEKEAIEKTSMYLPAGVYSFTVLSAEETERRKTGALMFALKLKLFDCDSDKTVTCMDWLCTDVMEHKLRHFCYSVGLSEGYEAGQVEAAEMVGRSGHVNVGVEETDAYGIRNKVIDYEKLTHKVAVDQVAMNAAKAEPDDVPF